VSYTFAAFIAIYTMPIKVYVAMTVTCICSEISAYIFYIEIIIIIFLGIQRFGVHFFVAFPPLNSHDSVSDTAPAAFNRFNRSGFSKIVLSPVFVASIFAC